MADDSKASAVPAIHKESKPPVVKDPDPIEYVDEFVLYHPAPGVSVRLITSDNWAQLGIELPDKEWNAANRFRILASEFGPKALNYLAADDGFEIVEE